MSALANAAVGKYLNEYFVSSFQKVATFRIVNNAKQGGNVASYFCAPDGRVLHVVAGPVNSTTMLREAKWVVETTRQAMKEAKDGITVTFDGEGLPADAAKERTFDRVLVSVGRRPNSAVPGLDRTKVKVNARGFAAPLSTSSHVHGAETGAPGFGRTAYAAAYVAPNSLRPVSTRIRPPRSVL